MQDYSALFETEKSESQKKLIIIRRILRSKVSTALMVAAITLIVETSNHR